MAGRKRSAKFTKEENIPEVPAEPDRVTVVTEVVEVIDAEPVPQAQDVEKVEESSEDNEETLTSVATPEPEPEAEKEEKKKDVVEGLFRRDAPSVSPEITIHKENKRLPLSLWIAIVVVVAVLVGGGLIWATGGAQSLGFLSGSKPTPTPIQTPAPTAAPLLSRSDITVQVLNGGGTAGAAGRMKTFLEEKGYTVSDTSNTDEYSHQTTEILVKPAKEAYLSLLKTDLETDYTLGTVSATLSDDVSYDAQVIVGKDE